MMSFRLRNQVFHQLADVLHIQASAVESAVRRNRTEHFADWMDSAFAGGVRAFHHQGRGAHAHDQAVAAIVKGKGGFFHRFVRSCRAAGQKTGAHPFQQMVGADVVRRDDHHPAASPSPDPVFCQTDRLRGACTGGVDLRVRSPGADELSELRMSHRQDFEQETAIERIRILFDGSLQLQDALDDLLS